MSTKANEEILLKKCLKGDSDAFGLIVAKYQGLVCAITYSGTVDVQGSEELAHQTFVEAWNKLSQLRDLSRFRPWLCTIARNRVKSFMRDKRRDILRKSKPMEHVDGNSIDAPGPLESAIKKEHIELVDAAIGQIHERYRAPLVLYYREQQSVERVAELLDLSEEIVKKRLQRARKMMKEKLSSIVEETLSATGPKRAFTTAVVASVAGLAVKGSGVAAAAGIAGTWSGGKISALATFVTSGMKANAVAAVAALVVGVGAAVTYKQITEPRGGGDSLETVSTAQVTKEGRGGFGEEGVAKVGDNTLKRSAGEASKGGLEHKPLASDSESARVRPPQGPGGFLLSGVVSDVDTGRPIKGARVEDDNYRGNEGAVCGSNGAFDYWTWPKEHFVKASAVGYESKRVLFRPSLMGHDMSGRLRFKLKRVERLEYGLRAVKEVWQYGEFPAFVLDVRNVSSLKGVVGQLNLRADGSRRTGKSFGALRLLFGGNDRKGFNPNIEYYPVFTEPYDGPIEVGAGEHVSLEFEMTGLSENYSLDRQEPLKPGRYAVGMGHFGGVGKPVFSTNIVDVEVLPVGVATRDELAAYLTPYEANGVKIEAGFVPNKTEIVLGEPIFATFMVKNHGDEPFTYEFGGDYRGTGRHDRFKINVVDSAGNQLPDPKAGPDGFVMFGGGIEMIRTAHPNDVASEKVNLLDFRKIQSPGVYAVTCGFVLNRAWHTSTGESDIPVKTSYELTVLPRAPVNVQRVIEELLVKARQRRGWALQAVINELCSFGGEAAAPGLIRMSGGGDTEHRIAAITGLGRIPGEESLVALIAGARDPELSIRIAALKSLGSFGSAEAVAVVVAALGDPNEAIRRQAAESLGRMKTDTAVDALAAVLPESEPKVAASILRAMGRTKSPRVFSAMVESLRSKQSECRYAAVDGVVAFGGKDAIAALKACVDGSDVDVNDMDLRETIVAKLAESLSQPIDAEWLMPVICSRRHARSLGDAPRLLRLYTGEKAAPALLNCLDFEDPSIRSYYNGEIIYHQGFCRGGLRIPWHYDLNRDGTAEELEQNRRTLEKIDAWIYHYYEHRMEEKSGPQYPDTWGEPVDEISIRIRVNQRVWPEGMPQLIWIDVRSHPGEGSVNLSGVPDVFEVEINGAWYVRRPALKGPTMGITAGHGSSFGKLHLDEKWCRKSDDEALHLTPGKYVLRVGLSITPADRRSGLAMSQQVQIEVIGVK